MKAVWLFSRRLDLTVFAGSALLSLALVAFGAWQGVLRGDAPEWAWVPAVLLVDVAHVWSTAFRVYFDPGELRRRPALYALVPAAGYAVAVLIFSAGEHVFWRVLAYVAVFHFIRQQWGWVALYRAKAGETDRTGALIDGAAVYAASLGPLIWWHAHLPRAFWWFLPGDFVALPRAAALLAAPVYAAALGAWLLRGISRYARGGGNPGKDIVIAGTAVTWAFGIVVFDSDYAFTVTNVLTHGIPYFALVWLFVKRRAAEGAPAAARVASFGPLAMLATVWLLAYAEELLWDRGIWHERSWLFGSAWNLPSLVRGLLVPALALPQITHYVLDGFIWRRRSNPDVAAALSPTLG